MPDDAVVEMLEGLVAAHAHLRRLDGFPHVRRGSQSVRDLRVQRVESYKADAAYGNYEYFVTSKILPPSKTLLLLQAVILKLAALGAARSLKLSVQLSVTRVSHSAIAGEGDPQGQAGQQQGVCHIR